MKNIKDKLRIKKFNYDGFNYVFTGITNEHIFMQIPWYEYELLLYIKNLNESGVYVDIGGNIGNHSLFFLNHCKSTKLYVFEPEIICYELLKNNLTQNTKKEFKSYNIAVWNKKERLKLIRFPSFKNTGMSKVMENDGENGTILVDADSLDNLISLNEKIVLIKIDVEGSEPKILNGAMKLINNNKPIIICEAASELEFKKINEILIPLGYKQPTRKFNATPTYIWVFEK